MFYRGDDRINGAAWIVFILSALLLLPWLGETLFNSKGEPREAIVAVTMLQSGDWILPLSSGADMPFKPPFMAWCIAGIARIFNSGEVTEYISRLPSAIAAICMIMGTFCWASRVRGDRFAIILSLIMLTCFEVFRAAMACRLDMILTACMVGALYVLYEIQNRRKDTFLLWLAAWALLTCAVLTKGPVGSLLPCAVAGIYYLLRGERFLPTLGRMTALALTSLIVPALWYYAAYLRGGEHFLNLMLEENIGRLTGNMSYESHTQPFYYNFITIIAGCLPWTLAVLMSVFAIRRWRRAPLKQAGLFALTAAVVVIGFYCIPSSKRSVYLLPAYPFICYGIASIIDSEAARGPVRAFTWLISILAILVPIAFIVLNFVEIPDIDISIGHANWYGYIMLAVPVILGLAWMINRHSPVGHLILTVWAMYLAYIACIMPAVLNPRSDKRLMADIPAQPDTEILVFSPPAESVNNAYRLFTLNYYYNDRIRPVSSVAEAAEYPPGTVLLIPAHADTSGIGTNYTVSRLTDRSCDHRGPLDIAIHR